MKSKKDTSLIKIIYIRSQSAEAAPPLGTILGNIGVNTVKFCDEFNKFTVKLPNFLVVKVKININDNKTFSFNLLSLSITYLLKILKYKKIIKVSVFDRIYEKEIMCINLKDILVLCLFKFPKKDLKESFNIFNGIIKSMNLKIVKNNNTC
jgi:large subunit ribosomal protein L11